MKTWDAAQKKIRRRSPAEVIESLSVESPFVFDPVEDVSDIPEFLDEFWDSFGSSADQLVDIPGRDVAYVRDTLIALSKFKHVLWCAEERRAAGSLTWALVDAYHAAFLGVRVLIALHGVHTYSVRGRAVLVDFAPGLGGINDQKTFRQEAKGLLSPVRLLRPTKEKIDQAETWGFVTRLCDVSSLDKESIEWACLSNLRTLAERKLSHVRNKIIYDSSYWTWRSDFSSAVLSEPQLGEMFVAPDDHVANLLKALEQVWNTCDRLSLPLVQELSVEVDVFKAPEGSDSYKIFAANAAF